MRMLPITAAGLSLWLGLGTPAFADPPWAPTPAGQGSLFWPPNWFASRSSAPKMGDAKADAAKDDKMKTAPVAEPARLIREREERAYLRRWAVCDRLSQIAESTGDDALRRKAEVLAERAFTLYLQRTGGAPAPGNNLDGESRLLDGARQGGSGTSLLPGRTAGVPGAGQANLRRDN
jgi:hypothetical protein